MFKRYRQRIQEILGLYKKIEKIQFMLNLMMEKQSQEFAEADYFRRFTLTTTGRLSKPIFPGQWAGDFAFFYSLSRLLYEYEFDNILELGTGQSTIFINDVIINENFGHFVLEHDMFFIEKTRSHLKEKNKVNFLPTNLVKKEINNGTANFMYELKGLEIINNIKIDLLIVDGPFGSDSLSRYEVIEIFNSGYLAEEFIIMFDDTHRKGEQETLNVLIDTLNTKGINHFVAHYKGSKRVTFLGTEKYELVKNF
jgi:hypothetical protein